MKITDNGQIDKDCLLYIFKQVSLIDLTRCKFDYGTTDKGIWMNAELNGHIVDAIEYDGNLFSVMDNDGTFNYLNPMKEAFDAMEDYASQFKALPTADKEQNWTLDYVKKKCTELLQKYHYKDYTTQKADAPERHIISSLNELKAWIETTVSQNQLKNSSDKVDIGLYSGYMNCLNKVSTIMQELNQQPDAPEEGKVTLTEVEGILNKHLRKCNDLGFLKQSKPDAYKCILDAMAECLELKTGEVDNFLRMHPEFRCLDVIGKFKNQSVKEGKKPALQEMIEIMEEGATAEEILKGRIGELDYPELKEFGFLSKILAAMEAYKNQSAPTEDKWIEGLPDKNGYYICWCIDPEEPGLIHYNKSTDWQNGFYNNRVTHYKKISAPPKTPITLTN